MISSLESLSAKDISVQELLNIKKIVDKIDGNLFATAKIPFAALSMKKRII